MSVLATMRVKVHDFEGMKQAVAKYGDAMIKNGCHWYKVYQRDGDDKEVLWMMEFDSHEAFENVGNMNTQRSSVDILFIERSPGVVNFDGSSVNITPHG